MAETYPANVPNLVETGSFVKTPVDTVYRFGNDIGKSMTRNMVTGELFNASWRIKMTSAEFQALMLWYHNTLNKVLTFNFPEPTTGTLREYSFIIPPKTNHIGVDLYSVTFNIRTKVGY